LHKQRWLTALIALPILLLVILQGGHLGFALFLLVVNGLAQWEFWGMFQPESDGPRSVKAILLGSLLLISFCTAQRTPTLCNPIYPLFVLVWLLFLLFLFYLISYGHIEDLVRDLMVSTLGFLYLPFLLGHLIWLRYLPEGEMWVLWLLGVIFAGDTAAFYCGQFWGNKKLYPQVSPGKTWVGAVGGIGACFIVVGLAGGWLLAPESTPKLACLGLALGLVGLLGDLFESMLKRQMDRKDTGHLLPGHGGMLDRLDSLLFAAPLVVYVRLFFLG
jgi:phosphatidate cytidylyltransferase